MFNSSANNEPAIEPAGNESVALQTRRAQSTVWGVLALIGVAEFLCGGWLVGLLINR